MQYAIKKQIKNMTQNGIKQLIYCVEKERNEKKQIKMEKNKKI